MDRLHRLAERDIVRQVEAERGGGKLLLMGDGERRAVAREAACRRQRGQSLRAVIRPGRDHTRAEPKGFRDLARLRRSEAGGEREWSEILVTPAHIADLVRITEDGTFRHAVAPNDAGSARPLNERDRRALLAFLRLL